MKENWDFMMKCWENIEILIDVQVSTEVWFKVQSEIGLYFEICDWVLDNFVGKLFMEKYYQMVCGSLKRWGENCSDNGN